MSDKEKNTTTTGNILESMFKYLSENMVDLEPEFQKVINDNFWDLLATESDSDKEKTNDRKKV